METVFNADEVLQMAIRSEENAGAFYRRAAELNKDRADVAFLLGLAEMEDAHKRTFEGIRADLMEKRQDLTAYQPNDEAARYLDAVSDGSAGEGSPRLAESLTGEETIQDLLKTGIRLEKDAILFYIGLADAVPEGLGRAKVKTIVREEQDHVATLTAELRRRDA